MQLSEKGTVQNHFVTMVRCPFGGRFALNQYAVAVIHFVLNDLRRPAGEGFDPGLELLVLPLHLNGLIPLAGPGTAQ